MEGYAEGDLRIDVETIGDVVRLAWKGKSSARDPGRTLRPFFEEVAKEAAARNATIEMRLNALEYFNSSTLAAIIRSVWRFCDQNTHVRITYRDACGWQRRSGDALRVLETDERVEVRGE